MRGDRPFLGLTAFLPRLSFEDRCRAVARKWRLLLRLAAATSLAFAFSTRVLHHEQAFFAPVAAVVVLLAGAGLRRRLMVELILGVAIGVLVGELLILTIGRGVWQLALVVTLTTTSAVFAGLKGVSLTQAANSGVLLAAVVPAAGAANPAVTRFLDALVGGVCAMAMVLLVPRNATRDIDKEVRPLLAQLVQVLDGVAEALRVSDPGVAERTLARARGLQAQVNTALNTADNVREVATMSPVRWRQRDDVARYSAMLIDLDHAIRDARVLARRVSTTLRLGEECGPGMEVAVQALSRGVRGCEDALTDPTRVAEAQESLVESVRLAVESLRGGMTLNRAAIVAQVRSLAADMLLATGMSRDELDVRLDF